MSQTAPSDPIAEQLRSPELHRRIEALLSLTRTPHQPLEDDVVEALIENLSSTSKAVQRHAACVIAAAAMRASAVRGRLVKLLESPQPAVRWAAAYALGRIGALDLRTRAPLAEALASSDGDVRWAALEMLVALGRSHPAPVRDCLMALLDRADANSRKMSLYGLRDLGIRDDDAVAAACAACADASSEVRLAALSFLKQTGAGGGLVAGSVLTCLTSDPVEGVRRAAALTFGFLADRSAPVIQALRKAAHDARDGSMRKAARLTLDRLKEEQ